MNTLSKELTAQILGGQAAWLKLRKKWAEILSSDRRNDLTAAHHLLANAALGRDWRKGFTSISEETRKGKNKLKSWISPDQALFDALWDLRSANLDPHKILDPFEGAISVKAFEALKFILPSEGSTYAHYTKDAFPRSLPDTDT